MATIKPFKAVRATRDKVALVSCKEPTVYSEKKLKSKLDFNPFTFLHVLYAVYKYANKKEVTLEQQFQLVHNRYLEFKEKNILTQDSKPAFYIYKKITPTDEYCGIIAGTSTEDYENNIIKRHEYTIEKREVLFEDYLRKTGFNADPVLLTYADNTTIDKIIKKHQKKRAEYEFTSLDKNTHLVWIINDVDDIKAIQFAFKTINALYIADGHHRCASSALLAKKEKNKNQSYNFILSCLIPESNLKISEFNRFVTDLNGLSKDEFLIKLDSFFIIKNKGQEYCHPQEKNNFSMYLEGTFYSLQLRKSAYKFTDSLSKLDAEILNRIVLNPILGIKDIRNDTRISYAASKKEDGLSLKKKVDSGKFRVAFGMLPVSIDELKELADEGLKMPPKSTYIEPKIRSALTIYEFVS